MYRRLLIGLLCLLGVAGLGNAQSGTQLDKAVELWLQGDDAHSLPLLSELAAEGRSEARLLLRPD